jgi:methionyl-tRNA formyltransferase
MFGLVFPSSLQYTFRDLGTPFMKIGFAGTPEFARCALQALINHSHQSEHAMEVVVVLTQPDRPAGRGMQLVAIPVKTCAQQHGIEVLQPRGLRLDGRWAEDAQAAQAQLAPLSLDVLVVAAYGLILPKWVLDMPRHGCLNIHASLLPRWRGAAPIQRAIEAGDQTTGITIMQMDEGLDTGDMLLVESLAIDDEDTAQTLHDRLATLGSSLIVQAIDDLAAQRLVATAQDEREVTYAAKLQKTEAALDWSAPAALLARRVRAFNPFPGTTAHLPGLNEPVKVWQASAVPGGEGIAPGTVVACASTGIDVATGDGLLRLLTLQKPGGKRQPVSVFLQSTPSLSLGLGSNH